MATDFTVGHSHQLTAHTDTVPRDTVPAPVTMSERLCLSAIYAPYLIIPLMLICYMLTSVHYRPVATSKPHQSLKQH